MHIFKNKLTWLAPLLVLFVIILFGSTLIPSVQPQPKNVPLAFVNEDKGMTIPQQGTINIGNNIAQMTQQKTASENDEEPVVKWTSIDNKEAVLEALDNQEYYGAIIIPEDFSQKQASLLTPNPSTPEVTILINQGMNPMVASMTTQMLNGIADGIESGIQTQFVQKAQAQNIALQPNQLQTFVNPITVHVENINEVGTNSMNGNAPVMLFQPLWMASIAGAVILFLAAKKLTITSKKQKLYTLLTQIVIGALLSLVAGFGLTWMAQTIGIHIPDFIDISLFLTVTYFAFFLLISAVLSWIGLKGMPIFILMLFFGAPLLSMAPEMMSPFYHDYVYSWLPMKFMIQGLRELFFFGQTFSFSGPVATLGWIAVGSFCIMIMSVVKKDATLHESTHRVSQ